VEFLQFPPKDMEIAKGLRQKMIKVLKDKLFSSAALTKMEAELKAK
jgi:hypothetical protein